MRCRSSTPIRFVLRDGLIVLLAGLVAFVVLHDWVRTRFGPTPEELAAEKRARYAAPSPIAVHAVHRYTRLSDEERRELTEYLRASLIPMPTWVEQLDRRTFQILCLGEDHESSSRDFLAREFFAGVPIDVLLLEETVDGLAHIDEAVAAGDAQVPLLDADIAAILRAARARNARIDVAGIEETERQRRARQRKEQANLRDESITRNFWGRFQPGRRHVILFGALHCASHPNWLFDRVRREASPRVAREMLSVRVFAQHQGQMVADFVHFLDQIGFPRRHFVIVDAQNLHPYLDDWFWLLSSSVRRYQSAIVFRD